MRQIAIFLGTFACPPYCLPMSSEISDKPLTTNGRTLCARALKHLKTFADHSELSLAEAAAQAIAHSQSHSPRRGRKLRDWTALTGVPLPQLTLRILLEQAIAKEALGTRISGGQALGRILKRHRKGARVDSGEERDLLKAYQHAVRNAARDTTRPSSERRCLAGAVAWLDHAERNRRGKPEPHELRHGWRSGPSWVRHGSVTIVNGQPIAVNERQRKI